MAYFQYSFSQHLFRPATVQTNTQYPATGGAFSVLASPFGGEEINKNFYNLAAFSNDATIRLGILESNSQIGYSVSTGYIMYAARQETEGAFYSGVPLVINPSLTTTTPYTFTVPLAFQVSSGNGIVTLSNGSVDIVNTKYISTTFGSAGQTGPYNTPAALVTYLNSRLAFSTLNSSNNFGFTGLAAPTAVTQTQWNTTWGNLTASPKSFYIYVNDAKTTNTGVLVTLSQSIAWGTSMTVVAGIVQTAISSAIGGLITIPVTTDGTYLTLAPTTDRTSQGCYEIRIERVSGDTSSVLDWLGWLANTSSNFSETWNYQSLFQFVSSSISSPASISIQGVGPYATLTFKPQDSTSTVADFLGSFGFPTNTVINYHTRLPLTSYNNKPLNYGGSLTVNNLTTRGNLSVSGNLSISGTTSYNNLNVTGTLTSTTQVTTNALHAGQLEGHLVAGYLPNPLFDLDMVNGILPQGWGVKMSNTPANPPIASSITNATAIPNVGTTFLTNNVTPLVGAYDAIYTKPAVNQQGVFIYSQFTIDPGLQNQWFQIKMPYKTTGAYATGDIGVYILDFTNSVLITPTVTAIPASASSSVFTTYFKTTASNIYWIVFYQLTVNAVLSTFEVGAVSVSDTLTTSPIIRAEYTSTYTTTPTTATQYQFDTLVENVGGSVVTTGSSYNSANWKFVPVLPGVYAVTVNFDHTAAVTVTIGQTFGLVLYQNGTAYAPFYTRHPDNASTYGLGGTGIVTIRVTQAQITAGTGFLDVRPVWTTTNPPVPNITAPYQPRVSIQWIGF